MTARGLMNEGGNKSQCDAMKEKEGKLSELMRDPVVSGKLNVHKNDIYITSKNII